MGRDLYRSAPIFRDTVDFCCDILKPHLTLDLRTILYPAPGEEEEAGRLLSQTAITQPAVFVIEYAMAKLWMDCGIHASAMAGHSIGEYVAACLAGVFSLEDALALIAERGRLIQSVPAGAMLAVTLSEQDLEPLLSAEISVAAVNSPNQTVASGPDSAIAALETTLRNKNIECKRLRTSHAFHSPMMELVVEAFVQQVARIKLHAPQLRYLSNVTGTWIRDDQATDPGYWGAHLRNTVRFADCGRNLLQESNSILLEVGPGETLLSLLRTQLEPRSTRPMIASMRHALAVQNDRDTWLTAAGRLWLLNSRLNWDGFYRGERRARLSLPTYPFERQRYWIEPKKSNEAPQTRLLEKRPDIADWFYAPSWKRSVIELLPQSNVGEADTWLLFAQDSSATDNLTKRLDGQGRVIRVRAGQSFRQISPELYELDPSRSEDYINLLKHMQESGRWPDRVVHAWISNAGRDTDLGESLDRGIFSVMFFVQAAADLDSTRRMELNVIGDRSYSVFGERVSSPAGSALNAFCGVIALEYANIVCRVIDLDLESNSELAADQMVGEIVSVASNETVAYRGSARWVREYSPIRLEKPQSEANSLNSGNSGIRLRDRGVYLISGGLGGFGLVLARYLARAVNAQIILTARTPLPPAAEWKSLLESSATSDAVKRKIEGIQSVEDAGGNVLVLEADVVDAGAMRRVLATVRARFGAIHGIIHAAGIGGVGMIQMKTHAEALAVISPKMQGTEWIREAIPSGNLDFVLLCSSISAVIPSFGLSDYAAANAYLDGFAATYDNPSGTRVLSSNWDTWREVGMAADMSLPGEVAQLKDDRLKHGILSAEAEEVFARLLYYSISQTVISTRDFNLLERQADQTIAAMRDISNSSTVETPLNVHGRPASMEEVAAAGDEIEQFIVTAWQELLGVEPIGVHDNFFQLGGHSLLGTQVLARIRDRFKIGLSLRTIFEAATPAELAQHIRITYWASGSPANASTLEREEIEI
jgi:acyl transferase domain-containing protein